jgi:hypothetical protein
MSEDAHKHGKDEELEALLKKLVPGPLNFDLLAELNRDQERIACDRELNSARVQWRRLIPLSIVSAVLMAGFGYLQFGERLAGNRDVPVEGGTVVATPVTPPSTETQYVPVSAHGYLLNTSSAGVIQTEEGPRQRLNLEYEDAYHWHDPASGTNIRFFQPRSEEVIVPLQTD